MKNHSLFVRLQYLYRKISIVVVRIRMRSYRPFIESNNTFDITSLLHQQIDSIVFGLIKNNEPPANTSKEVQHSELSFTKVDNENHQDSEIENVSSIESEFAKYLKQKKSSSLIHPYMGDKLKKVHGNMFIALYDMQGRGIWLWLNYMRILQVMP